VPLFELIVQPVLVLFPHGGQRRARSNAFLSLGQAVTARAERTAADAAIDEAVARAGALEHALVEGTG